MSRVNPLATPTCCTHHTHFFFLLPQPLSLAIELKSICSGKPDRCPETNETRQRQRQRRQRRLRLRQQFGLEKFAPRDTLSRSAKELPVPAAAAAAQVPLRCLCSWFYATVAKAEPGQFGRNVAARNVLSCAYFLCPATTAATTTRMASNNANAAHKPLYSITTQKSQCDSLDLPSAWRIWFCFVWLKCCPIRLWVVPSAAKAADDRRPCRRVRVCFFLIRNLLSRTCICISNSRTCRSTCRYPAFLTSISAACDLHNAVHVVQKVEKVHVIELCLQRRRTMTWANPSLYNLFSVSGSCGSNCCCCHNLK